MAKQLSCAFAPFADLFARVAELRPTCVMALTTPAVITKHDQRSGRREVLYIVRGVWLVLGRFGITWRERVSMREFTLTI